MPRIHILPDRLITQIAAGEVVERPASVVKELVENALDAGASDVAVELEAGGRRRIAVSRRRPGMGRDDALLAFDRHATSKIASFDDLERVATLGFRGEALASIAAVAARRAAHRRARPATAARVRDRGRARAASPSRRRRRAARRIEVASLFFNVPARRKFLKSAADRAAPLPGGGPGLRPGAARTCASASPRGPRAARRPAAGAAQRPRERVGADLRRRARRAAGRDPAEPGATADEAIAGFVGRPRRARGRRQFVFVNRRLMRDRARARRLLPRGARGVAERGVPGSLPLPRAAARGGGRQRPSAEGRGALPRSRAARPRPRRAARGLARARGEEPAPLRAPSARRRTSPSPGRGSADGRPWPATAGGAVHRRARRPRCQL